MSSAECISRYRPKTTKNSVYHRGSVIDVALDIRKGSPTYGQFVSTELSEKNHKVVFVPKGFAHGFLSLEDDTCVTCLQTKMFSKECDASIRSDSFGMDWDVQNPIISKKDLDAQTLEQFISPFIYTQK